MGSPFNDAYQEVEHGIRGMLREFVVWCADGWQIDNRGLSDDEKYSYEYMAGWNAAMTDGLEGALAMFLDEML